MRVVGVEPTRSNEQNLLRVPCLPFHHTREGYLLSLRLALLALRLRVLRYLAAKISASNALLPPQI
jgi:hypothetical protein